MIPLAVGEERIEKNPNITVIKQPKTGKLFIRRIDDGSVDKMPAKTVIKLKEKTMTH